MADRHINETQLIIRHTCACEVEVHQINERLDKLMSKFDDFVAAATANDAKLTAALDNIIADEKVLLKEIKDLKDQLSAGSGLTPAQEAQLDAVIAKMTNNVSKADGIAADVPDLPAPPTEV